MAKQTFKFETVDQVSSFCEALENVRLDVNWDSVRKTVTVEGTQENVLDASDAFDHFMVSP